MHFNRLLPILRGALALAVFLTVALASRAKVTAAPPVYPDRVHVSNGCHLSTITYLARYLAQYPAEQGEPLVITLRNADGVRRPHTIALLSWQGESWCRDEYYGVFRLSDRSGSRPEGQRLVARVEKALEQKANRLIRAGAAPERSFPPADMSSEQRMHDVTVAVGNIHFPASIYWVRSGKRDIPLAFFRPAAGQIAVYDPMHGTSLAECAVPDDAKIVAAVATRLGYRVESVRADATGSLGTLVAANLPVTGGAR